MWTRSELKSKAKEVLKRAYWKAFLISFIITIAGGTLISAPQFNFDLGRDYKFRNPQMHNDMFYNFDNYDMFGMHSFNFMNIIPIIAILVLVLFLVVFFIVGIKVFLGYPLKVGGARYYISAHSGDENLDFLGYIFRKDRYINTVKTMFFRDLFIFLWSLLFVIPGIVKYYSYSMVDYILADNPKMDYSRALSISKAMTANGKFSIFVLDLSFIGWYILGAMALGIGVFFVTPYVHATRMELYLTLRSKVIADGICSPEEFGLILQN